MDINYIYRGKHFTIYTYVKISCRIPKTCTMLCVNYMPIKLKKIKWQNNLNGVDLNHCALLRKQYETSNEFCCEPGPHNPPQTPKREIDDFCCRYWRQIESQNL